MKCKRGDGETTRQMLAAPNGAVFVWCNKFTSYAKSLVHHLMRDDLVVVPVGWLTGDGWRGQTLPGLVIDHAAQLTESQADSACCIRVALKRKKPNVLA